MDSDGRCTVIACKDGSVRFLGSLQDGGFVQARTNTFELEMSCRGGGARLCFFVEGV